MMEMKPVDLKVAIQYANKIVVKKCGDGLMKDVMKVCVSWFLKVAYSEGWVLKKEAEDQDDDEVQGNLFAENEGDKDGQDAA